MLVVLNNFNRRQVAFYATPGTGASSKITFDQALPYAPTPDPAAPSAAPGSGLCVIGFTVRKGRVADIAPDQTGDLLSVLTAPSCSPLLLPAVPDGHARAFH